MLHVPEGDVIIKTLHDKQPLVLKDHHKRSKRGDRYRGKIRR